MNSFYKKRRNKIPTAFLSKCRRVKPRQFFVILDSPQLWCELDCDGEVGDSSTIPIAFLRNTFEFCAKKDLFMQIQVILEKQI